MTLKGLFGGVSNKVLGSALNLISVFQP